MSFTLASHKRRQEAHTAATDALRREFVTSSAKLEHMARLSVGRGLGKVIENQKALEQEARLFKAAASGLQAEANKWDAQYRAFTAEVESLVGVEDWAYSTEVSLRRLAEAIAAVSDTIAALPSPS